MNARARVVGWSVLALVALADTDAFADSAAKNADALFREGRALMNQGHFAEARDKLAESERLDRGIGTLFNLADCNEHLGLIATAWNEFVEVSIEARSSHQTLRATTADARAAALLPRLPRLMIEGVAPSGSDVKKDGSLVSAADIGKALPVDPGAHTIRVERRSELVLEKSVTVAEGTIARIDITPPLENKPDLAPPVIAVVAASPPPAKPTLTSTSVASAPPAQESHAPVQKILGGVIAGAGLASLGVGTYFGVESMSKRDDSRSHCVSNVCDAAGIDMRNSAISAGNVSTVFFVAGAIAAVGGGVLFFTAPRPQEETAAARPSSRLAWMSAAPFAGPTGSGLVLSGAFQ